MTDNVNDAEMEIVVDCDRQEIIVKGDDKNTTYTFSELAEQYAEVNPPMTKLQLMPRRKKLRHLGKIKVGSHFISPEGTEGILIEKTPSAAVVIITNYVMNEEERDDSYYLGKQRVTLTMKVWVKDEQNVRTGLENKK